MTDWRLGVKVTGKELGHFKLAEEEGNLKEEVGKRAKGRRLTEER